MISEPPLLHLFCGKIAAGKSTLAARLAAAPGTVLIAEDAWLATLYPDEMPTVAAWRERCARLERAFEPHVRALLAAGIGVVLDFHANTRRRRDWLRGLAQGGPARAVLHWLDASDATCLARLRARNAAGEHPYRTDDATFEAFTRAFEPPGADEGWNVRRHAQD